MSYNKALKKLEKLPPGERQLAAGQYVWQVKKGKSHCGCAVGKLLPERVRRALFTAKKKEPNGFFVELPNLSGVSALRSFLGLSSVNLETDDSGIAGLTLLELRRLQGQNDQAVNAGNTYANRKARYKHVIAWLKEQIAGSAL